MIQYGKNDNNDYYYMHMIMFLMLCKIKGALHRKIINQNSFWMCLYYKLNMWKYMAMKITVYCILVHSGNLLLL